MLVLITINGMFVIVFNTLYQSEDCWHNIEQIYALSLY